MTDEDSGFCAYCGEPGATVSMGKNDNGHEVWVHGKHVGPYLSRALGRDLMDRQREDDRVSALRHHDD